MKAICDVDGVLFDTKRSMFELYKRAFSDFGVTLLPSTFSNCIWGRPWAEAREELDAVAHIDRIYVRKQGYTISFRYGANTSLINLLRFMDVDLVTWDSEEATRGKLPRNDVWWKTLECGVPIRSIEFWNEVVDKDSIVISADHEVFKAANEAGLYHTVNWRNNNA